MRPILSIVTAITLLAQVAACGSGDKGGVDEISGFPPAEVSEDLPASPDARERLPEVTEVTEEGGRNAREEVAETAADLGEPEVVGPPPVASYEWFLQVLDQEDPAGLEEFLAAYDGPFCEEGLCVVTTCLEGAESVGIRGEFNEWETDAMEPMAFAPGCFYRVLEGLEPVGWTEYKLYVDDEWLLDPFNRYIRFSDVALNSAIYQEGHGRLALVPDLYSPQLDNHRNLYVYLPAQAFSQPERRFPVLYMQDGFNVFDNPLAQFGSWNVNLTAEELAASGEAEPVIIVGIDTDDRLNEYLYTDLIIDNGDEYIFLEPKLDEYAEFLVTVVKPLVDEEFPTLPGREHTGLAGSSLGGISSLYIAWNHAGLFSMVASLSGSFWVGEAGTGTEEHPALRDMITASQPTAAQASLKVYLDSGGMAAGGPDPMPYAHDARVFTDWTRNALCSLGWSNRPEWDDDGNLDTPPENFPPQTNPDEVPTLYWSAEVPESYAGWHDYLKPQATLLHLVGLGHAHNEAAWEARFPAVLRFLFPVIK